MPSFNIATRLRPRVLRKAAELYGAARVTSARIPGRRIPERPGVTVITANWNTLPFLEVLVDAVLSRSPVGTRILVVDNGSTDGSREYLSGRTDVESVLLPINIGHGPALDLAVAKASTDTIVVLDVDAFPISASWLEIPQAALREGKKVVGAAVHRSYIHPCFLVARRQMLLNEGPSLRARGRYPKPGRRRLGVFLDTAESLSQALLVRYGTAAFEKTPITSIDGPGMYGTVFGGLVYHNFHATTGKDREAGLARFLLAAKRYAEGPTHSVP